MRESIFVSAIRSFCKWFFAVLGILFAFFLCSLLYSLYSGTTLIEPKTTLTVIADAEGKKETVSSTAPVILQLNIHGVIGEPEKLDSSIVDNILVESRTGTLANDRVKGILIHFNTPGGAVTDSDDIYQMLLDYKAKYNVPIYAYVDGLCASGGMYISSAVDKVYASPSSIIGSVGVIFGPFVNVFESLEKIGVHTKTLTQGKDKDAMSPFRPWKEGEDESYKAIMTYFYNRFVDIVSKAKPKLDKEKLMNEYGAHVFDAVTAADLGYIDQVTTSRSQALLALLDAAKVDPKKPYQVVQLEPKSEWLSKLFSKSPMLLRGQIEHRLDLGQPKINGQFAYLYQPEK